MLLLFRPLAIPDIKENRFYAAIGYVSILCLVPLLLKKNSDFSQFHGKQGLVLLIGEVIIVFLNVIPFFGPIIWAVGTAFFVLLALKGIHAAWNGQYWKMWFLSDYARKINID